MLDRLQNIIFPPKCGICGKLNSNYLCRRCEQNLEKETIWEFVQNHNPYIYFDERIAIFAYKSFIRNYILDYKFNEKAYLSRTFVNFIIKNKKLFQKIQSYDMIIPVPISRKRKKERGYNQSLLIAKEISNKTGIQLVTNCIYKTIHTIEQSKLNREDREKNAQGVYAVRNNEILRNKKILLFDDIYTTGNTVNSCCEILKKGEPEKIGVLVLAKD